MDMDGIEFIELGKAVVGHKADKLNKRGAYEDDFIKIETSMQGDPDYLLVVTRKAIQDPKRPHLDTNNPTTYYVQRQDGETAEIIRHHGEHVYLKGHMLWLLRDATDTFGELREKLIAKYPNIEVREGY